MYGYWCNKCAERKNFCANEKCAFFRGESDLNNHMRYCKASCHVSKKCGNLCAFIAGWANEIFGVYSEKDFEANKREKCAGKVDFKDCEQCCKDSFECDNKKIRYYYESN